MKAFLAWTVLGLCITAIFSGIRQIRHISRRHAAASVEIGTAGPVGLRKINFYRWIGGDPPIYRVDDVTKRFIVKRARPTDVEVVLDQYLIERGYEIVWEAQ